MIDMEMSLSNHLGLYLIHCKSTHQVDKVKVPVTPVVTGDIQFLKD